MPSPAVPEPQPRRILGVDPGTRVCGWAVVDHEGSRFRLVDCGAIRTRGPGMERRLMEVSAGVEAAARRHGPQVVAVETPFLGRNPATAMAIGMARGAAMVAAARCDLEVREYAPATVKKAVTGSGSASKEQVAAMVRVLLGLTEVPGPADITDAMAVALACGHRGPAETALARGTSTRTTTRGRRGGTGRRR